MVKVNGPARLRFLLFVTLSWLGPRPASGACPRPCACYLPTEVHCTFRYLTSIPDGFPPHVERVNLGYNSLVRLAETDFSGLSRLELLLLHSNGIHSIPDKAFSDLQALQVLKLSYNKVRRLQRDALYGLRNLTRLHLDHNGLEFINPQAFHGLAALRLLQLEGNQLTRLHADTFVTLRYLQVFKVSSVRYLHLSDNLLSSLPQEMLPSLSSLESLYLHGNPWTCDCRLSWLAGWVREKPDVIKCKKDRNPSSPLQCPLCTNPRTAKGQPLAGVPEEAFLCAPPALEGSAGERSLDAVLGGAPEPIAPRDFTAPWGSLALNLTDQAGNEATLVCSVEKPAATSSTAALAAENSSVVLDVAFTVSLACDLAEGHILAVWQILAAYSDAPLLLERSRALPGALGDPYGQVAAGPKDTFTGVQATLRAQPTWLLQARGALRLDRAATTPGTAWLRWSSQARLLSPSPEPAPGPWTLILSEQRVELARTVLAGRTVALDCPGLGHPAPRLEWLLADGSRVRAPHASEDGRVLVRGDGTLELRAADASDTGAYRCVSTASHDTDVRTYWVTVVDAPGDAPAQGPAPHVVFLDEPLDLPCRVTTGIPNPRISWVLPGAVVLPGPATDRHVLNNGTLRITRVTRRDQGLYRCIAANPSGMDVLTHRVAVRIQEPREQRVETEGSGVEAQETPPAPRPAPAPGGAEAGRPVGGQRRGRFREQRRQRLPSVRRIDPRRWAALLEMAKRRGQVGVPGSPPGNVPARKAQRPTAPREEEESSGLSPLGEEEVDPAGPRKISDRPSTKTPAYAGGSPLGSAPGPPLGKPTQCHLPGATASVQRFPTAAASTWSSAPRLDTATPGFSPQGRTASPGTVHAEGRNGPRGGPLETAGRRVQAGRVGELPGGTKGHGPMHSPPSPSAPPSGWAQAAPSQAHPSWSRSTPAPASTPFAPRRRIWGHGPLSGRHRTPASHRQRHGHVRPRLKGPAEGNASVGADPETGSGCPSCTVAAEPALPRLGPGQPPKAGPDSIPRAPVSGPSLLRKGQPETTPAPGYFGTRGPRVTTQAPTSTAADESSATPTAPPSVAGTAAARREAFVTAARASRPAKPSVPTPGATRGKAPLRQGSARGHSQREGLRAQRRPGGQKGPAPVAPSTPPAGSPRHAAPLPATRPRPLVTQAPATMAPAPRVAQTRRPGLRPMGKALPSPAPDPTAPHLPSPESSGGLLQVTTTTAIPPTSKVVAAPTDGAGPRTPEREMEWRGDAGDPGTRHPSPASVTWRALRGLTPAGTPAVPSVPVFTQAPGGSTGASTPTGQRPGTRTPGQEAGSTRTPEEVGGALASIPPSRGRQSTPARNSSPGPSPPHPALGPGDPPAPTTPSSSPWGHPGAPPASWTTTAHPRVKAPGSSSPHVDPEQPAPERELSPSTGPGPTSLLSGTDRGFHSQPPFHPAALLVQPTPPPRVGEHQLGHQTDAAATEAEGLGSPKVATLFPHWPGQQKAEDGGSRETPARETTPAVGLPFDPRSRKLFERPRMVGGRAASYTVLAHSDALLPCEASGNPPPALRWTRVSSGLVLSGKKEGGRFQVLDNGTLSIRSVDIQDRGQYLCSASNAFGSDHLYVTLSVVSYPPRMLESLASELLVPSGSTLALPCRADGRPRPSIAWTLPNQTVVPEFSDGAGRAQVTRNGTLVLRDLGVPDQGSYRCTASNAAGQDWLQVDIQVIAALPVILEPKRQVVAGTWGHSLRLPCTATGAPPPRVHWVLPDGSEVGPLQPARPKLLLFANGTLQVSDPTSSEQGTYRCVATSPAGSDARLVLVTVEPRGTPPQIDSASPTWTEVDLGDRLRLDCSATGQPPPRVLWQLPSKAVVEEQHRMGSRIHVYPNGSLVIDSATDKDEGDYLCVARNPSGEDLVSMQVGLRREAARIAGEPLLSQQVRQGGAFRVDCPASGSPPPDISWVLPDGSVARAREGGRRARGLTLFANGTLHLSGVEVAAQGDYTCHAQNTLGRDEMRVRLTVVPAAPRIQPGAAPAPRVQTGDTAVLDCEVAGEPPPTRFWLLPSGVALTASRDRYALHANGSLAIDRVTPRDAGAYVCVARNPGGSDAQTYRLHVQDPPQDPAAPGSVLRATAVRHSRALLPCAPRATWLVPGALALRAPYHGGRLSVHANGSLEIRNVRPSDAAEFVCVAPGRRALAVRLDVLEPARRPSFRSPAHEKVVARLGRPTALHCSADGYPPPDILWVLPNGTRLPGAGRPGNASLVISRTARSDAGRYRCGARNPAGYIEKLIVVEVSQRPVILTPALGSVLGRWGESIWLHCVSDGSPKPRLTWTVPPGAVLERPGPQGPYVLHENGTLVIRAAQARDAGSYVCQARNSVGHARIAVPVTVLAYPPRLTRRPPRSVLARTGVAVQLSCGALGVPPPLITWEGPVRIPLSRARRGSASEPAPQPGTLVLQDPQTEDSGTYKCTARNSLGSDSAATFVRVV